MFGVLDPLQNASNLVAAVHLLEIIPSTNPNRPMILQAFMKNRCQLDLGIPRWQMIAVRP